MVKTEVKVKRRRRRCKWCGDLVEVDNWDRGLCQFCMLEYYVMESIVSSYGKTVR